MSWLMQLNDLEFAAVCFYIFTALLTLLVWVWSKFKKSEALSMFNKRMATLWVLILLFTIAMTAGKAVACVFFAALSIVGSNEYEKMVLPKPQKRFQKAVLYGFVGLQYLLLYFGSYSLFAVLIPFSVFVTVPLSGMIYRAETKVWEKCAADYIGLLLTVYFMSYMCAYLTLDISGGKGLLLFVLILTLMSDFFQAICGFLCGKHYVVPILSPHKTWEGLIGGGFMSAGLAWVMGKYLTPFGNAELLILGFVLNFCAFCGDVTISAIKRYAKVKDSSNLLPGHGGLLDRFDSILLTAPVLFWYYILF